MKNCYKTQILCPICGHDRVIYLQKRLKSLSCPVCHQKLFMTYATGNQDEVDQHGFSFYANELFKHGDTAKAIDEVFGCG